MIATFRAGGLAAAICLLSATIGAGPSQAFTQTSNIVSAEASHATAASEPLQIVLPVQTAPTPDLTIGAPILDIAVVPTPAPIGAAPLAIVPVPLPAVAIVAPAAPAKERASLAQLVAAHRSSAIPDRERECLAGAIYFEAKGEPLPGQVAVGQVIANRAKSGRFPKSFCGVVFQRSQFSFVRGRALPPIPRASAHWQTAVAVAHIVANELHDAVAPRSLFFHARYVSPNWKRMSRVATVGNHVFYR